VMYWFGGRFGPVMASHHSGSVAWLAVGSA
jgi:hypothetical protein